MRSSRSIIISLFLVVVTGLLGGCITQETTISSVDVSQVKPTLSPLFQLQPTSEATAILPSPVPTTQISRVRTAADNQFIERPIFDDQLAANWSLDGSKGMFTNLKHTTFIKSGAFSLAATPLQGEAQLQLSVKPDTLIRYQRDNVLGISFWLSGGKSSIAPEDLGVSILGSNDFPYWNANDTSVKLNGRVTDDSPLFSITRLYYLHINKVIPPETWVEITVWLDDLQFDPHYTYVTGLFIQNDKDFRDTFYVDNVRLIMQK